MLYVVFGKNAGGTRSIYRDKDYWVYDSDDGSIEKCKGYMLKQLNAKSPGIFANVTFNRHTFGWGIPKEFVDGIYPVYNSSAKFICVKDTGTFIYEDNSLYKLNSFEGFATNTPIGRNEKGYFVPDELLFEWQVGITFIDNIDIVRLRRALVTDQLGLYIKDIVRGHQGGSG